MMEEKNNTTNKYDYVNTVANLSRSARDISRDIKFREGLYPEAYVLLQNDNIINKFKYLSRKS